MPKTKKFSIFITFILTLSACNINSKKDIDRSFSILGVELRQNTMQLIDEIDLKISESVEPRVKFSKDEKISMLNPLLPYKSIVKINRYHKLTKAYVAFLSEIEEKFINSDKNPLIQNDIVTQKGEEYLGRTKLYSEEIQKLCINKFTKNKVSRTLNTEYILNIEGTKVSHISYYFDDLPIRGIIVYLRQKKYDILTLEKDFLNDLIFQNLTTQLNIQH